MGLSPKPLLVSIDLVGEKESSDSSGPLLSKLLEAQSKRRKQRVLRKRERSRRILMKRRAYLEGSGRPAIKIQRKVKTLKRLVPNSESVGLDGLFRVTADYILDLQMRVKLMQIMVNALSGSDDQ